MASALKTTAGQAIRTTARRAWVIACTSGWFWQSVPSRFQTKAMASSRNTSTPRLARNKTISEYSANTSGLAQLTSHCQELKVVQTQPGTSSSQVKLPGREIGEDLRQVRFEGVGFAPVRVDAKVVAIPRISSAGGSRPGMFAGHVVEHQIDDQADPGAAKPAGEGTQIVDGAETRFHRAIIGDRVAAVVVPLPGLQQRHQMQVLHPQLGQIVEVVADAGQAAGEPVGVGGIADHRGLLEPVRLEQPPLVQLVQFFAAVAKGRRGRHDQGVRQVRGPVAVEQGQRLDQIGPPAVEAEREGAPTDRVHVREHLSRAVVEPGRRAEHGDILRYRAVPRCAGQRQDRIVAARTRSAEDSAQSVTATPAARISWTARSESPGFSSTNRVRCIGTVTP